MLRLAVLLFLVLMSIGTLGSPAQAQPREGFSDIVEPLLPAVVNISTTQMVEGPRGQDLPQFPPGSPFEEFFDEFYNRQAPDVPREATALGSGFIIDPEGFVVTNNHVIADADEIRVVLHDETTLEARVVGVDERTDLALLRVDAPEPLPYVEWGDGDSMRVGDWVLAIGNPFGLGGTVTAGIVSAQARNINAGPYDDFIQTDAAINRGNSGGPMFDLDGRVIGVSTAIFSPSGGSVGVGFAISSTLARPVIEQLKEFGETRRGWLGVRIQTITPEIAQGLGRDANTAGALVAGVTPGGPAEGVLKPGDIVLRFNGRRVAEMRDLPRMVADAEVGSEADLTIWREGEEQTVTVDLGQLEEAERQGLLALDRPEDRSPNAVPGQPGDDEALRAYGLELSPIDENVARQFGLEETDGVVITGIAPGSPAAERGLRIGEVIYEVNQKPVSEPREVAQALQSAADQGQGSVLLFVGREGDFRFVPLSVQAG